MAAVEAAIEIRQEPDFLPAFVAEVEIVVSALAVQQVLELLPFGQVAAAEMKPGPNFADLAAVAHTAA